MRGPEITGSILLFSETARFLHRPHPFLASPPPLETIFTKFTTRHEVREVCIQPVVTQSLTADRGHWS